MKKDTFDNFKDLVPEDTIPTAGLRLLSYITPDGKVRYSVSHAGDIPVSQLVGLLEMVKQDLVINALRFSRGDDE